MKFGTIVLILALGGLLVPGKADEPWQGQFTSLLAKYATPTGVRYSAWKANTGDLQKLQAITDQIAAQGPSSGDKNSQLAYYINAYNAWILRGVLDRYPVKSVADIAPLFGFFFQKRITVAGERTSFDKLEKKIRDLHFNEPRTHFALSCATQSCPPLGAFAYSAAKLDSELDQNAKAFLQNNPYGLEVAGQEYRLSKIFDWYKKDFESAGGLVAFINRYRDPKMPTDAKIAYQEYDWSLNDSK
jgi:Protein of unknown function, DUF547